MNDEFDEEEFKKEANGKKEYVRDLFKRFNIVLRVLNSRWKIKVDEFEEFCWDTYYNFCITFPWMSVTNSVHFILAHAADCIRANNGYGLAQLGEGRLEV